MEFPARYTGHRGVASEWSTAQSDQLIYAVQIDTEGSAAKDFPIISYGSWRITGYLEVDSVGDNGAIHSFTCLASARKPIVMIMYGPPRDCKGKALGKKTRLRKCIRPFVEINSPGHDELRACLSL